MLKLKKNLREFLKANVKPEHFPDLIERLEEYEKHRVDEIVRWQIYTNQTKLGVPFSISVTSSDFEEVEDLKPYKWHTREKWNGNPDEYWLIERSEPDDDGDSVLLTRIKKTGLFADTSHFMFIEPLKVEDD